MNTEIKVIGLDIYGTVLASDEADNVMPPRKGIERFFDLCESRQIRIVSASDSDIENVKMDLESCFKRFPERRMSVERFNYFFLMDQLPVKDFSLIVGHFDILPRELIVIGDGWKDIGGAKRIGTKYLQVPEYTIRDGYDFDFGEIRI